MCVYFFPIILISFSYLPFQRSSPRCTSALPPAFDARCVSRFTATGSSLSKCSATQSRYLLSAKLPCCAVCWYVKDSCKLEFYCVIIGVYLFLCVLFVIFVSFFFCLFICLLLTTYHIIPSNKHLHRLFERDEVRFVLNSVFVTDYCVWIQSIRSGENTHVYILLFFNLFMFLSVFSIFIFLFVFPQRRKIRQVLRRRLLHHHHQG